MATRTRYKSPSPSPGTMSLDAAPTPTLPLSPLSSSTSSATVPLSPYSQPLPHGTNAAPPGRTQPVFQRTTDLPIHSYPTHRTREPERTVLPPASALGEYSNSSSGGHVLGTRPNSIFGQPSLGGATVPNGYVALNRPPNMHFSHPEADKQRSLSIQSLISTPGADQASFPVGEGAAGKKRKGSDDTDGGRDTTRSSSVLSTVGLSMEDPDVRDAVEALGGLKADFTNAASPPPGQPLALPVNVQEPLLELIQSSAHPIVSNAISLSSSTYAASKSYSPSFRYVAESAENVAIPVTNVVSAVGRRTGIESVIRRGLAGTRRDSTDPRDQKRRKSERDLPPPPKPIKNQSLIQSQNAAPKERGWHSRLIYSSTGLATALSDESRKSLRYCLSILSSANANLVRVIETLTTIVAELEDYVRNQRRNTDAGSVAGLLPESCEQRRQRLAESVDRLKDEALATLKTVVTTISQYAGGALPENARTLVKTQLLAFPLRWQAATGAQPNSPTSPTTKAVAQDSEAEANSPTSKAIRVLAMAREGLDMLRSVGQVVDETLRSADEWCDRIGKRRESEVVSPNSAGGPREKKRVSWVDGGGGKEKFPIVIEDDETEAKK